MGAIPTNELSISTLKALAEVGRSLIQTPIFIKLQSIEGHAPHGRAAFGVAADRKIVFKWMDSNGNIESKPTK